MKRRSYLLGLGFFAVLLLAVPLLVLCFHRPDSVNARAIARLRLGMTEREVEGVLGRSADSEAEITKDESGRVMKYMAKQWVAPGRDLRVAFNGAGNAITIVERVSSRAGVLDKLYGWIGF